MSKVTSRYQVRFLNHQGDCFYMFWLIVLAGVYFTLKYGRDYDQMGPPIAKYEPIVPKDT